MIVILVHGEPDSYHDESTPEWQLDLLVEEAIDRYQVTDEDVSVEYGATPCTVERSSLGGGFICTSCGTFCACYVCSE